MSENYLRPHLGFLQLPSSKSRSRPFEQSSRCERVFLHFLVREQCHASLISRTLRSPLFFSPSSYSLFPFSFLPPLSPIYPLFPLSPLFSASSTCDQGNSALMWGQATHTLCASLFPSPMSLMRRPAHFMPRSIRFVCVAASFFELPEICELLLAKGADVHHRNNKKQQVPPRLA